MLETRNDFTEQLWQQTQSGSEIRTVYVLLQNETFCQKTV